MNFQSIIEGSGFSLMLVGMSVVFTALLILMILMKLLKYGMNRLHCLRIAKQAEAGTLRGTATSCPQPEEIPGVLIAAIASTLILEQELVHDEESMVLTLRGLPKPYSNWWMPETMKADLFKSGVKFRPVTSKAAGASN